MIAARHTRLMLVFIALAIVTSLGHVCVLPGHAHAAPASVERHGHDEPAHGHHHAPGDVGHGESCDAWRSTAPMAGPPIVAAGTMVPPPVAIGPRISPRFLDSSCTRSSPIYLVHRALLI